jgi:hypothetical protein
MSTSIRSTSARPLFYQSKTLASAERSFFLSLCGREKSMCSKTMFPDCFLAVFLHVAVLISVALAAII